MHNFTSNHLLLYIFDELNADESTQIEQVLLTDNNFLTEYLDLCSNLNFAQKLLIKPHHKLQNHIVAQIDKLYEVC